MTGVDDRSAPVVAVYACESVESGRLGGEGPRRGREAGRGAGAIAGTNGLVENCEACDILLCESGTELPFPFAYGLRGVAGGIGTPLGGVGALSMRVKGGVCGAGVLEAERLQC